MKMNAKNVLMTALAVCTTAVLADDFVREDELVAVTDLQLCESGEKRIDMRLQIPVATLTDEVLKGITYSARGWRFDIPEDDPGRTVTITARAGTLVGGVFTPTDSEMTVAAARTGEGTFDWTPSAVLNKVYQLAHVTRCGDAIEESVYGYFDFTGCDFLVQLEAAAVADDSHTIGMALDGTHPWRPISSEIPRSGIRTDPGLTTAETSAMTFSVTGCGTLHFEYALDGGSLTVAVDGEPFETLASADDWQRRSVELGRYGTHEIRFVYTAAGGGKTAALREVCWSPDEGAARACGEMDGVCLDLCEGVRTPKWLSEVLPFAYSSTNWIGDVRGAAARVTVAELEGTGPDVTKWAVKGSCELYDGPGEGTVRWSPQTGVWKATFEIPGGSHVEDAWFDLRDSCGDGILLMLE